MLDASLPLLVTPQPFCASEWGYSTLPNAVHHHAASVQLKLIVVWSCLPLSRSSSKSEVSGSLVLTANVDEETDERTAIDQTRTEFNERTRGDDITHSRGVWTDRSR